MEPILIRLLEAVAAAVLSGLYARLLHLYRHQSTTQHALQEGVRAMLRSDLIRLHREYVVGGKPIPYAIKEQAEDVYNAYHSLGGNGMGTRLWHEIRDAKVGKDT